MAKIILYNDDVHSVVEVMEFLAKFGLEYNDSVKLIKEIEECGQAIIKETTIEEAIFNYQNLLSSYTLNYEIIY